MVNFPASLDDTTSLPDPASGSYTNNPSHFGLHGSENAAIRAIEAKVGVGASTPPGGGYIFTSSSNGTSSWQPAPAAGVWGLITGTLSNQTDLQTALNAKLALGGGTMTGLLILSADPVANLGAATKQYVDSLGSTSLVRNETPGGSVNGSNTAFTTASTYATGSLKVYLNGQRLAPGSGIDYVEVTQGFTMQYAPATGDVLLVDYETTNTSRFVQGSNSIIVQETPTGLVNSSNTVYTTLQAKYVANTLEVFINGLQQTKTTDYTETTPGSGVFTFVTAPLTGDIVKVSYQFATGASGNADTVDGVHGSSSAGSAGVLVADTYGWQALNATLTYSSADSPVFVATTSVDLSAFIQIGDRVWLTQTTSKYFIVVAINTTTITLYGGTDYTLANAAITSPYISKLKSPQGFNTSPTKWRVSVTDVTQRSQGSAVTGTWYNLGTKSIDVPIGVWDLRYKVNLGIIPGSAGNSGAMVTLSTVNNTESDSDMSMQVDASSVSQIFNTVALPGKYVVIVTKTTYYINSKVIVGTGTNTVYNDNSGVPLLIEAICALL